MNLGATPAAAPIQGHQKVNGHFYVRQLCASAPGSKMFSNGTAGISAVQ
jgi:hypothetical protein